jgi:hypothetical protein
MSIREVARSAGSGFVALPEGVFGLRKHVREAAGLDDEVGRQLVVLV